MIDSTWSNQKTDVKSERLISNLVKYFCIIGCSTIFILSIINFQAIYQYLKYEIKNSFTSERLKIETQINLIAEAQQEYQYRNNYLIIPKIDLNTQIFWDIKETDLDISMKKGVTHFPNSNLPGENGNLILLGYSSLPWWQNQGGGIVFTLISKLSAGDRININYENNYYVYQVQNKKITKHQIIFDPVDKPILILITYNPLSLSKQKIIITAEQISTSKKESVNTDSSADTDSQIIIP